MIEEHDHEAQVGAWRSRVGSDPSTTALILAFERAFRVVWGRAHVTLGDITLAAVGERVLYDAAERYPILSALRLEPPGVSCDDLALQAPSIERSDVDEAVQFVLVELLSVLGRLTGDVLSPMLHAALQADRLLDENSLP